jgi:hypothetical protein
MTRWPWGWALAAGLGLLGCGGGGGGGGATAQKPEPPRPPEPVPEQPEPTQPTTQPLHIEGLYITQGSQRMDRSVPLVQGKPGYLRVFVLAQEWSGPVPSVLVRIRDRDGRELLDQEVPAPGPAVPRALQEGDRDKVWSLRLDGDLIQPGNTVQASLSSVPPGAVTGSLSFPADGTPLAMDVVPVAPFRVTFIPIRTGGRVGNVTSGGRTLASWVESLVQMFPLGQVTPKLAGEYVTDLDPHDPRQRRQLLDQLEAMRLASGEDDYQYFFGVYAARLGRNQTGLAYVPRALDRLYRTAIGWDGAGITDGSSYANTTAHELGHTLGLNHAPCGPPDNFPGEPDAGFPDRDGGIGACGFDVRTGMPKDPAFYKDVMGYCSPVWSSDYDCKAILRFRAREPQAVSRRLGSAAQGPRSEAQDCLLVRGQLLRGQAELEPAFQVHRAPALPGAGGDYLLTALDAQGGVLTSVPFAPAPLGDLADDSVPAAFCFVIPMTAQMQDSLATLRVSRDGVTLGERHGAGHGRGDEPHPQAPRDGHGLVHLLWHAHAYPEVLVKDAHTGAVLSMGAGGRLELETRAHELECLFSDGLRTLRRRVTVQ